MQIYEEVTTDDGGLELRNFVPVCGAESLFYGVGALTTHYISIPRHVSTGTFSCSCYLPHIFYCHTTRPHSLSLVLLAHLFVP